MKRLTEHRDNGVILVNIIEQKESAIHRLAAIEDILGDDYDLDRLREMNGKPVYRRPLEGEA